MKTHLDAKLPAVTTHRIARDACVGGGVPGVTRACEASLSVCARGVGGTIVGRRRGRALVDIDARPCGAC